MSGNVPALADNQNTDKLFLLFGRSGGFMVRSLMSAVPKITDKHVYLISGNSTFFRN